VDKSTKPALNLYGVLDNELGRMHELLKTFISHTNAHRDPNSYPRYTSVNDDNITEVFQRIVLVQNIIIKAVHKHDELVQDKVAELALTSGEQNDDVQV
jgi:hypothetical protein